MNVHREQNGTKQEAELSPFCYLPTSWFNTLNTAQLKGI